MMFGARASSGPSEVGPRATESGVATRTTTEALLTLDSMHQT